MNAEEDLQGTSGKAGSAGSRGWVTIIATIFAAILILVTAGIGGYLVATRRNRVLPQSETGKNGTQMSPASQTPVTPSSISESQTSPAPDFTVGWKTYTCKDLYTLKYPNTWSVHLIETNGHADCDSASVYFSDRPYDQIPPGGGDATIISVFVDASRNSLPVFPYDNGRSDNPTIRPYTTNSYHGIRGEDVQANDIVLLQNPDGGYVSLVLSSYKRPGAEGIFSSMLSSFRFLGH